MTKLPDTPIEELDQLADEAERIGSDLSEVLGVLATEAASEQTLAWSGKLTDAAERVYGAMDKIFAGINGLPTHIEPSASDEVAKAEEPTPEVDNDFFASARPLLMFIAENPASKLEQIREHVPVEVVKSSTAFTKWRDQAKTEFGALGIELVWTSEGRTRGTKHTLLVGAGHDELSEWLYQQPEVSEEAEEEPAVEELVTPTVEPVLVGRSQLDSAKTQDAAELKPVFQKEAIIALVRSKTTTHVKELVRLAYNTNHVEPSKFFDLKEYLMELVRTGEIEYCGDATYGPRNGVVTEIERDPAADPESSNGNGFNADFEKLLKSVRTASSGQTRKPTQRGRYKGGGRSRR